MKASTTLGHTYLSLGSIILLFFSYALFISCSSFEDDPPAPVLASHDLPQEILDNIFTPDIPKALYQVDNFLNKIKQNGMAIHEGSNPPELYTFDGSNRIGIKYIIEHDCIYDEKAPANVDAEYGKYEETIQIFKNQQDILVADVSYSSVGDANHSQFPSGLDRGSGTGYVSGNNNNFTIFYKVEKNDGIFNGIPYEAIWIISGTVSDSGNAREISNITKCLIMLGKGPDAQDQIANRGSIRIFKDASPEWVQPDVVIADFTPTEGPYSTVVTINGSGFGASIDENEVRFNNTVATVLQASTSQLIVAVPKGAGSGSVTVQVNEKMGTGNQFTYIPVYTVSTLAGTGQAGLLDGSGTSAQFNQPYGIAVDAEGVVYVTDLGNQIIRMIAPEGSVRTLETSERITSPNGITFDALGNFYVTDFIYPGYGLLWNLNPAGEILSVDQFNFPGGVTVDDRGNVYLAETGSRGLIWMIPLEGDSRILNANEPFNSPSGVAVDAQGNVYVAETGNHLIRKITPEGAISTFGGASRFNNPTGITVDAAGNVYVADTGNHQIHQITPEETVSTLAGIGQAGFLDGIGSSAEFNHPTGVAMDAAGIIYVADSTNHRIRKMVLE